MSFGRWRSLAPDLIIGLVLLAVAFALRRNGYSRNGVWYDDAWVAVGAVKGSIADIPMTGGAHPGFTFVLWLQHEVIGGPVERLAFLALLFGTAGAAVLYGVLRSLGYERVGCLLVSVGLAVSPAHVIYSGRVKSYTIDVVLVALLLAALPRLAQRRWTWVGAAAWVGVAVLAGSLSGYLVVSAALVIGMLVLHPNGDRLQRSVALVVQGAVQGAWILYARRFVDLDEIENFMELYFDGHVERSANPIEMGGNLLRHFQRVVDVHPGAPASLLLPLAIIVLAGLVIGAMGQLGRPRAIVSRFALAAIAFAALGGVFDWFPFGPRTFDYPTALGAPGARHGLWLVPMTAVGVCNVVDRVLAWVSGKPNAANAVRAAVAAWAVVLLWSRWAPAEEPVSGRRHQVAMVERAADEGAFIVLDEWVSYQFHALSDRPVTLRPTPEEMIGFVPHPDPADGTVVGISFTPEALTELLAQTDHDRLVLYGLDVPYADVMVDAGWEQHETHERAGLRVTVWTKAGT